MKELLVKGKYCECDCHIQIGGSGRQKTYDEFAKCGGCERTYEKGRCPDCVKKIEQKTAEEIFTKIETMIKKDRKEIAAEEQEYQGEEIAEIVHDELLDKIDVMKKKFVTEGKAGV